MSDERRHDLLAVKIHNFDRVVAVRRREASMVRGEGHADRGFGALGQIQIFRHAIIGGA
jgi:hypothetical protein